jgi:hypothetical protein
MRSRRKFDDAPFGTECLTRLMDTPSIVSIDVHFQRYSAGTLHSG